MLVSVFSINAFCALFGKIEVQCPSSQCKIYMDNKYMASGTKIFKLKPGKHKIKVMEKGVVLLNTYKYITANKYIAIKVVPKKVIAAVPVVLEEEATPEEMSITAEATTEAVTSPETAASIDLLKEEEGGFKLNWYLSPGYRLEDAYANGCAGLTGGLEFGWNRSLLFDLSLSSFSGDNKLAVIQEGTLTVSSLDIGLVYKMGGFYVGTGAGCYTFDHTVADSTIKAKKALNLEYEETIDNNYGFYCKGGYRFTAFGGINFDLGVKGVIVNTVARSTEKNTVTPDETENSLKYGLPITTAYLGIVF